MRNVKLNKDDITHEASLSKGGFFLHFYMFRPF